MRFSRVAPPLSPLLICALLPCAAVVAQAPAFQNLRFEEDWSQMDELGDGGFFDRIKKLELSDSVWMSVGGEARARFESWSDFGFADRNDDEFLLLRSHTHLDFHFGEHWRVFVEGRFNTNTDRSLPGGTRPALDADEGDLQNGFVEARYAVGGLAIMARLGRQELQYGAQRLVSPLDWANNRRLFEGGLLRLEGERWKLDAFIAKPVTVKRSDFNEHNDNRLFNGLYLTTKSRDGRYGIDAYFFSLHDNNGAAREGDRYTVGTRITGPIRDNWRFEVEAAYQFGNFNGDRIRAWMLTAETTYSFPNAPWMPSVTLGLDYASGDSDPTDGRDETFRHLFPLGHAYLGFIDAVGRQNIIDARGSVAAWPIPGKVRAKCDLHFFWRADEDDALYNAGGGVLRRPFATDFRGNTYPVDDQEIGAELDLTLLYKINRHTDFLAGYSHFFTGDFLDATGAHEDVDFLYTQLAFQF